MAAGPDSMKSFLALHRKEIADRHSRGADGLSTCTDLTAMTDEALRIAFGSLPAETKDHVAVFALGGYGRGELFPSSDVDVMVLCTSGTRRDEARNAAKRFLHVLWDADLNVGHSVRSVEEALALHGTSHDAWTSVLESRFLCGSRELADSLTDQMTARVRVGQDLWFTKGIFADLRSRAERFGNSVKLLEPNIKKSAGGLRDLHAVFWLHRGNDQAFFTPIDPSSPALRMFADRLLERGQLEKDEHAKALAALSFLFRVRHEMHYQRDSQHDTLEYALQLAVAERLGYGGQAELRSVEVFMHDYYTHARTVHRLNLQLCQRFREFLEPAGQDRGAGPRLSEVLIVRNGMLSIDPEVSRFNDPVQTLEAFVLSAENDLELDFRLRGALERSVDCFHADQDALGPLFRRILKSKRVAATFRDMSDLGTLSALIPEFGKLVAFFQHNVYHYYTADEHTLIALANAERLRIERGLLHEVFRMLRRKEILYMAILLHDIAKPLGVADHELTGVEMARAILESLGMEDIFPDVAFLIRNHLAMEQLAFRRNIHDGATIGEFCERFEHPEWLDYLYVLTYADLSAVNRNVWTEWKATMLQEMYQRTSEVLRRNLKGVQIEQFHKAQREAAEEQIISTLSAEIPREEVTRHLQGIPSNAYVSVFTEQEISQHIQKILHRERVSTLIAQSEGYTEVTVIAPDAPFALSKFCAVLSANDATIFDANIFTRDDGIIIDKFRVADAATRRQLDPRACLKIEEDFVHVMEGELDIDHLFREHHRKWKRRPRRAVNPNTRMDVEFQDTATHTIIDVYASDTVGFLYRLTETISRLGLDIYFAKIATRVDGIVDAFYVLDRSGNPVTGEEQRQSIRAEILETIRSTTEMELSQGAEERTRNRTDRQKK